MKQADYYDFLSDSAKATLAAECAAGPQRQFEGVHPGATDAERDAIGAKLYRDKFERDTFCPMGHYPGGFKPRPVIRDRLRAEGFLA